MKKLLLLTALVFGMLILNSCKDETLADAQSVQNELEYEARIGPKTKGNQTDYYEE